MAFGPVDPRLVGVDTTPAGNIALTVQYQCNPQRKACADNHTARAWHTYAPLSLSMATAEDRAEVADIVRALINTVKSYQAPQSQTVVAADRPAVVRGGNGTTSQGGGEKRGPGRPPGSKNKAQPERTAAGQPMARNAVHPSPAAIAAIPDVDLDDL